MNFWLCAFFSLHPRRGCWHRIEVSHASGVAKVWNAVKKSHVEVISHHRVCAILIDRLPGLIDLSIGKRGVLNSGIICTTTLFHLKFFLRGHHLLDKVQLNKQLPITKSTQVKNQNLCSVSRILALPCLLSGSHRLKRTRLVWFSLYFTTISIFWLIIEDSSKSQSANEVLCQD